MKLIVQVNTMVQGRFYRASSEPQEVPDEDARRILDAGYGYVWRESEEEKPKIVEKKKPRAKTRAKRSR